MASGAGGTARFIVIKIMAAGRSENCVHIAFSKSFPEIVSVLFCSKDFFRLAPKKRKKKLLLHWARYMASKKRKTIAGRHKWEGKERIEF